jgi:Mg-chelatase subunit ChlD
MYRALDAPRSKFAMPPPPNRPNQAGRGGFCGTSPGNHNKRSRDDASETSGRTALSAVGSSSLQGSIQTSVISIRSSKHGRQRRHERNISKRQLQAAIKHGQRQRVRSDRFKYTHNGLVFITDTNGNEITSYFQSLDMPFRTVHRMSERDHYEAKVQMTQNAAAFCKSHSVLLVDTSGSMRNSDVQGSRTRLSAVWLAIAEDFVRNRIESHIASTRDAISIILMGEDAKVLMHQAPTDWITYNRILTIHKEGTILPAGHGCYGPALRKAQDILMEYETADCQLTMVVLSDGRPSDGSIIKGLNLSGAKEQFHQSVVYLSSRLGKRFTLRTIGMGAADQFETLQEMTHVANNYGSLGAFQLPSLSRSGLGAAMSSIATSLTESQSQTNNWMNDGQQRQMRKVLRENRKEIPLLTEEVNADEFTIYRDEHVTHMEFIDDMFQERPLQNEGAKGVAIKKVAFGEGTERNAFQFFEVAADNKTVVGKPLVAKESRYVMDTYGPEAVAKMDKFVRRFCRIQRQAAKTAEAFNAKLDTIQNLDSETARVSVLPCSVYYVNEPSRGGRIPYIVEPRIPPEDFEKWNSNNGVSRISIFRNESFLLDSNAGVLSV